MGIPRNTAIACSGQGGIQEDAGTDGVGLPAPITVLTMQGSHPWFHPWFTRVPPIGAHLAMIRILRE